MGEVYRAQDTKLDRAVAIKILPEAFAADTERIARFQREAKTLASLNHPNIAQIHGLEESNGIRALVMELIEGEDLAQRVARGAVPVAEALTIAKQMAEALEAAHDQGIIHRDLKPANIKMRRDGTVKVLDFGLAKAMEPAGVASLSVSRSPTITTPAMTEAGVILGTAAYMSPEQARGQQTDRRADIWAFGCVLYELLTGRRAFDGQGVSETLARVLEREPDWSRLPATLPPALCTYLRRGLQKDPRQRVQAIGDVRLALEGAFETAVEQTAGPGAVALRHRVALGVVTAIIASGAIIGTLVWRAALWVEPAPPPVSRLQVMPTGTAALSIGWNDRDVAITPDGSRLIYVGNHGTQIFVRALDGLAPVAVFTGRAVSGVFVSPDGQWIGFRDAFSLKKVALDGGPPVTLGTIDTAGSSGATWGPDDTIIVATNSVDTGLQRLSADGGPLTVLTRPDRAKGEADHFWPEMLPGGRGVLFTITSLAGALDTAQVAVLDLQTGTHRVLVRGGSHAHYVSSGHLVYAAAGTLRAVPFDLDRLESRGMPVTVVPDVVTTIKGGVNAVVAGNGTLAYMLGPIEGTPRTLVWVDRQGLETPIPSLPPRPYLLPALSPDGTRFAVFANDQQRDLWLWDLRRTTLTPLTSAPGVDVVHVWTRDSRRLIFTSERAGVRNLFWQAADGASAAERLTDSPHTQYPTGVSPDGRVIFTDESPTSANDVMAMELDAPRRVTTLVQSPSNEQNGTVSPDGHWLAYEANDSGRFEIYVRPFPDVNTGRSQVSTTGGTRPIWTQGGRELVYVSPTGALMAVGVMRGQAWAATTPAVVVKPGYLTNLNWWGRSYDVSPDGQRFLMIKEGGADGPPAPASIVVVQHWVEELKRLVPTK